MLVHKEDDQKRTGNYITPNTKLALLFTERDF